jgi:hypothetical protein
MSCFSCNARPDTLSTCAVCKTATYCSRECQATHWSAKNGHKLACASESADGGEVITHCDSLLARVAAKNPRLFGAARACGDRTVALPKSAASSIVLAAVQEAEMPQDGAKRSAAAAAKPAASRKRSNSKSRVRVKRAAAGPAVREEETTGMDHLPVELLQTILEEVDIETAVKMARTSRTFAELFRRMRTSARILDKIAKGQYPLQDTKEAVWHAELMRRAIKFILADVHGRRRADRLHEVLEVLQPETFAVLFLALGRPPGYDYTTYSTYIEELHSFWRDEDDNPADVDNEEWEILKEMVKNSKAAKVPDPQELFIHIARIGDDDDLFINYIQLLAWVPNSFHLGYNVFHDLFQADVFYNPEEPMHDVLELIFLESDSLTAVDWANFFYYSYRLEINHDLVNDDDEDNEFDRRFGGTSHYRLIQRFADFEDGDRLPYIPERVFASLRGIFTDPSVPKAQKQDGWRAIETRGPNGEDWLAIWNLFVDAMKTRRRTDSPPKAGLPTAMDAASV